MSKDNGMVHKIALIWAVMIAFMTLAIGFTLGMSVGRGELKKPKAGASYELAIVAKSGKGISARYHPFENYYPGAKNLKKDLLFQKAIFDNGFFRIEESGKK